MHDIAGKPAEAERELSAEIKKSAQKDEKGAEEQKGAAYFAKGIHKRSVEEEAGEVKEVDELREVQEELRAQCGGKFEVWK
jgi:hypothetical protein